MLKKLPVINIKATKIDLSNYGLKEFPSEVFKCKNLKKLNLSKNMISVLPKEIANLKRLENLDLSENKISILYAQVFTLKNLRTLILNNNSIKKLPKQVGNLKKLITLGISGNKLSDLPGEINQLTGLEKLNIANNLFSIFPSQILNLSLLEYVWLNNNPFTSFPSKEIIQKLPRLKAVYCYSSARNSLKNCDKDYFRLSKVKGNALPYLTLATDTLNPLLEKNRIDAESGPGWKGRFKNKVFICYAHTDTIYVDKLKVHIKGLQHTGIQLNVWDDSRIKTGQKWKDEISKALGESYIAILFISPDFLASDFINNDELPVILKSATNEGTKILPVIVKPSVFLKHKILSQFQCVNDTSSPLSSMKENEVEFVLAKLANDVVDIIEGK